MRIDLGWRLKHVFWGVCCVAVLTDQAFPGCPGSLTQELLDTTPQGAQYTFEDNIQYNLGNQSVATAVTVNVIPITGSCRQYSEELEKITACFGTTSYDLRIDLKEPVYETKFECHCDNRQYDSESECLQRCSVTLGCFVGICQPGAPRICRTAVAQCNEVQIDHIDVAWWEPADPADQTPECTKMASAVNNAILQHEEAHVTSLATHQHSRQPREMRATSCGSTLTDVDNQNEAKLLPFRQQCDTSFSGGYRGYPDNPIILTQIHQRIRFLVQDTT
jgi:hypothetical protein